MFPLIGSDLRRQMNLGGASSSPPTHTAILNEAKSLRSERHQQKRRHESAYRIQSWWRGIQEIKKTRVALRRQFYEDPMSITGLRCLVLLGDSDEDVLQTWSSAIAASGEDTVFDLSRAQNQGSWCVLIRQAGLLLLRSVAASPLSPRSVIHLQVLNSMLSSTAAKRVLGLGGSLIPPCIAKYLVDHGFFSLVSQSLQKIPIEAKDSLSLPPLIYLANLPFSIFSADTPSFSQSLNHFISVILTIPLLPNRLPIPALSHFSSHLPLNYLHIIDLESCSSDMDVQLKVHLLANLLAFTPPRYRRLPPEALVAYLVLLTKILDSIPIGTLHSDTPSAVPSLAQELSDSEGEDESPSFSMPALMSRSSRQKPDLDTKTLKRLATLPSATHIVTLLNATQPTTSSGQARQAFTAFLLALTSAWPSSKDKVLAHLLMQGGFVSGLYHGYVQKSVIGEDQSEGSLLDSANAPLLQPLLLLADLYAQALLTMGDDEFFGTSSIGTSISMTASNPLTIPDLISFSKQLLNVAFLLYWKETAMDTSVNGGRARISLLEAAREKVTKCLVAIHARDSRKSFVPQNHWLISSLKLDLRSFVDAAIYEENQLSKTANRLSKRQLTYLSPRLGILNNIPFCIPFSTRVKIFRHFVRNDRRKMSHDDGYGHHSSIQVRRDHIAEDGFNKLQGVNLKDTISIAFIDQFGQPEAGIDGGGLFKEFFTSLCKEIFNTDRGLWLANMKNEIYPNPHAYATQPQSLEWYRFIGMVLGKAIYDGILVDFAFAGFFLAKWLKKQSFLDDLASLDPVLYNGLVFLKHYDGDPEDLSLNFTVVTEDFDVAKTVELVPNGSNIPVTRENRLLYIVLVSHYRLSKQIKLQSEVFFEGLSEIIDPKWLRMFNQQEAQILIGGSNSGVDLDDLRKHTVYGGIYDDNEETIVAFWNAANSFDQEQRKALLRFVTSCSRSPLLGFKELAPQFSISDSGNEQDRLPTASTCFNLLKLPRYKSEKVLREKVLQAITSAAGFDFS